MFVGSWRIMCLCIFLKIISISIMRLLLSFALFPGGIFWKINFHLSLRFLLVIWGRNRISNKNVSLLPSKVLLRFDTRSISVEFRCTIFSWGAQIRGGLHVKTPISLEKLFNFGGFFEKKIPKFLPPQIFRTYKNFWKAPLKKFLLEYFMKPTSSSKFLDKNIF